MATKTWTGAVSANWNTAGNWDTNSVPTSADDAVIGTTGTSPIIPLNSGFTVNTLTMNGTDTLTLGDNSNTGNSQSLTATNGFSLAGGASILGQGTLTGSITTNGAATVGVKAINGQNTPQFTINGTINDIADGLTLFVGADSSQQNLNPTNLIVQNKSSANTVHAVTFDTSAAVAGQLVLQWLGSNLGLKVNTQMAVGAGQVFLSGGSSTSDVTLTDASGITLSTGIIFGIGTVAAPVTATGAATISTNFGPLEITGAITDSGNALTLATLSSGDKLILDSTDTAHAVKLAAGTSLELGTGASLTVGTTVAIGSNTLTLDGGGAALAGAGATLSTGTVIGSGKLAAVTATGAAKIAAKNGTLETTGAIVDSGNALTLTVTGSGDKILIDGTSQVNTFSFNGANGTLELNTGGVLTIANNLSIGNATVKLDGGSAALNNPTVSIAAGSISGAGVVNAVVTASGAANIVAGGGILDLQHQVTDNGNLLTLAMASASDTLELDFNATAHSVSFNGGKLYLHNQGGTAVTIGSQMQVGSGTIVIDTANNTLTDTFGITLGGGSIQGFGKINGSLTGSGFVEANGGTLELQSAIGNSAGPTFLIGSLPGTVLQVDSTVGSGNTFFFQNLTTGKLGLGNDSGFNSTISGLYAHGSGKNNYVDIEGHTVTISNVSGQGTASGTITLSDGAVLNLTGIVSGGNWSANAVSDGAGGTAIYLNEKPATPADFNADGVSDVLWRNNTNGDTGFWAISNNTIAGWVGFGSTPTSYSIVGNADFNGDRNADVLWRNAASGDTGFWAISNNVQTWHDLGVAPTTYSVVGTGDFAGDGTSDVLWRNNTSGDTGYWEISNNAQFWHGFGQSPTTYSVVGVGDFNNDGTSDVLWRNGTSGDTGYWTIVNGAIAGWTDLGQSPTTYSVVGVGDFNGDGNADVLWRNPTNGDTGYWTIANNAISGWHGLGQSPTTYNVVGVGDFNGDGISDVLWRNVSNGDTGYWRIANNTIAGWTGLGQSPTTYTVENGATSAGAQGNAGGGTAFGFADASLPALASNAATGSGAGAAASGGDQPNAAAAAGLALLPPNPAAPTLSLPQ